jgi:hypothetical protein
MTEPHKRLPASSFEARRRLVAHLRPVVAPLSGEEIRRAVRNDKKNDSQLRTDLGHIRSNDAGRHSLIGEKRLFWLCERLGVDPRLALPGAPAPKVIKPRVH